MKNLFAYLAAFACGLAPAMVSAHAQFSVHHHADGGYWLSIVPEIAVFVLFFGGVFLAFNHLKQMRKSLKIPLGDRETLRH